MEIKIDIIRILQAVEAEYGQNGLLDRIFKLFNIDLLHLKDEDLEIDYNKGIIVINKVGELPIYKIEVYDEYYTFLKIYSDYTSMHYYDNNRCLFRKTMSFNIANDEILVLDELDDERFKSRRIIKTHKDDIDLNNGTFEKEQLNYYYPPITEEYKSTANETSKVVKVPGNVYVYSNHQIENATTRQYTEGFIETSCSINKPNIAFLGRTRNPQELLVSTIKTPAPNILIRGRIQSEEIFLYSVQIIKVNNIITFNLTTSNLLDRKSQDDSFHVFSESFNTLTPADLDLLIESITNFVKKPFASELKRELEAIKKQLLISSHKIIRDVDFFDFKFAMFDDFEHLAFDIYENHSSYEAAINRLLNNQPGDIPPVLKKS